MTDLHSSAPQACSHCKVRKKKCDRVLPHCTACRQKLIKCTYEEDQSQKELRELRSQLELLKSTSHSSSPLSHGQLGICTVIRYPIPSQWYMPFLLDHCELPKIWKMILRPDTNICADYDLCFPRSARTNPRDTEPFSDKEWMQASLSDPCMFHGALFAASSHLEVLRGESDSPITLYHRQHATKLLLDRVSSSQTVPDTYIAAVMYLWHYERMSCRAREAEVHKQGIQQMVKANGGLSSLGLGGFLSHMIILIDIGDAILSASMPAFDSVDSYQYPEAPVTLLSPVLQQPETTLCAKAIGTSLFPLLKRVHEATLAFEYDIGLEQSQTLTSLMDGNTAAVNGVDRESPLPAAIWYAACIHLTSIQYHLPFSCDKNQEYVEALRLCLSLLPQGLAAEIDSALYVWLCFTGATAAKERQNWFLAKVGPVVMSLARNELDLIKTGLVRFCKIRSRLASA